MIKTLKLKNIQSHKDSEFNFSKGINCIVGSSNNGKSAVLRGLNWAIYNRPLGTDILLSSWSYDKKGNQIEEMSVEVEKENSTLIRKKSATENSYYVDGEKLESIKTDVPEDVERFFCLSETNVQRQMDQPFLLSLTSGQVAAYFNKVVRLDVIDKILSNAESVRRKTKSKLEESEEKIEDYGKQIEKFEWLENAEKLIKKYENISEKEQLLTDEVNKLSDELQQVVVFSQLQNKYEKIIENKKSINEIKKLYVECNLLEESVESLEESLNKLKVLKSSKCNSDFNSAKKLISKFRESAENIEDVQNELNHLSTSIENYKYYENMIFVNKKEIEDLKKQLPKTCPLCGGILNKDGECENER